MPFKNPTQFNRRLLTRLFSKVYVSSDKFFNGSPCWGWSAAHSKQGYGMFGYNCRMQHAHRVMYLLFVGNVAPGFHCDHLCRNRGCVNPAHIEAVTPKENSIRGESCWGINARKTQCSQGHPFNETNTYYAPGVPDQRKCRTCMNERAKARDRRIRQLPKSHPDRVIYEQKHRERGRQKLADLRALPYDHPDRVEYRRKQALAHRRMRAKKRLSKA